MNRSLYCEYKGYLIKEVFVPTHAKWIYIINKVQNAYFTTLEQAKKYIDNNLIK